MFLSSFLVLVLVVVAVLYYYILHGRWRLKPNKLPMSLNNWKLKKGCDSKCNEIKMDYIAGL